MLPHVTFCLNIFHLLECDCFASVCITIISNQSDVWVMYPCIIVKKFFSSHKTTLSLLSSFISLLPSSSIATFLKSWKEPESTGQGFVKQTIWREVISGFPCNNSLWKRVVVRTLTKIFQHYLQYKFYPMHRSKLLMKQWYLTFSHLTDEWILCFQMSSSIKTWKLSEFLQRQRHCSWKGS